MPTYKGRWTASVEQDFEVDADNVEEAREAVGREEVIEIIDFEIVSIEEVTNGEEV